MGGRRDGANAPMAGLDDAAGWDNRWIVEATFDEPGEYVLRCQAHDGALPVAQDITVTGRSKSSTHCKHGAASVRPSGGDPEVPRISCLSINPRELRPSDAISDIEWTTKPCRYVSTAGEIFRDDTRVLDEPAVNLDVRVVARSSAKQIARDVHPIEATSRETCRTPVG